MSEVMPFSDHKVSCAVCESTRLVPFFELSNVPVVCNQLLTSPEDARRSQVGDIKLAFCEDCGNIFNYAFDPTKLDYNASYDNALHFSPKFQEFAQRLVTHLITNYRLAGGEVAEIGCGDGYFLRLMLDQGVGRAVGYDPSMADGRLDSLPDISNLTILPEAFGEQELPDNLDAVICRHVLEHIVDPLGFLTTIRRSLNERDCVGYFEVPNAEWMLSSNSLWDVIYEHVIYWTAPALINTMKRAGFHPVRVETGFNDQYLMVVVQPSAVDQGAVVQMPQTVDVMKGAAIQFGKASRKNMQDWETRLSELANCGKRAVLWGAGSKGVTFLNVIPSAAHVVTSVVDVNERKQGMFVAGSAHPIVAPVELETIAPDVVLVANEIYLGEIRAAIEAMGLKPEFLIISG